MKAIITKYLKTVDCTPSWSAVLPVYLAVIANPDATAAGLKAARDELARMAKFADLHVAAQKKPAPATK